MSGWRIIGQTIFCRVVAREKNRRKALIWGTSDLGGQLAHTIRKSAWLGLDLVAYIEDEAADAASVYALARSARDSGQIEQIVSQARRGEFDILYIALPTVASGPTWRVYRSSVSMTLLIWGVDGWVKRMEDITLSSLIRDELF